ncbi:hypothetical protein GMORB2_1461 [Geosmithia morbida]|uniref:Uncharacterized protein n=1 Tax=Geosmithia morbida TaxID=1094350 RepID=A0A9P5D7Y2_9HYPO|nr:uncharacterized protein GMORB2_1461 [Geosmithia morbida]KAF4126215.1 hypothetical protein GMORB2_1461 [Geosmithia morbida]
MVRALLLSALALAFGSGTLPAYDDVRARRQIVTEISRQLSRDIPSSARNDLMDFLDRWRSSKLTFIMEQEVRLTDACDDDCAALGCNMPRLVTSRVSDTHAIRDTFPGSALGAAALCHLIGG